MAEPIRYLALAALLLAAAGPAPAQVRLKPDAPPATAEARTDCLGSERTLAERRRAWNAAARRHGEDATALADEGRALDQRRAQVQPADVAALNDFNDRNAARNARVEAHNARMAELERERAALHADEAALRQRCSGRAFSPRPAAPASAAR